MSMPGFSAETALMETSRLYKLSKMRQQSARGTPREGILMALMEVDPPSVSCYIGCRQLGGSREYCYDQCCKDDNCYHPHPHLAL
jgi:hypothetical protein